MNQMPMGQGPGPANKQIDPNQEVETNAYVPTYNVKPEFQQAVLGAIGKYPFNQIQQVMNACKVTTLDHNQLTQLMNALGSFPYQDVADLLANVNQFLVVVPPPMDDVEEDMTEDLPSDEELEADGGDPPTEEAAPAK